MLGTLGVDLVLLGLPHLQNAALSHVQDRDHAVIHFLDSWPGTDPR